MASEKRQRAQQLGQAWREVSLWTVMFHQSFADRLGLNITDHKALDILVTIGPMTAGQLAEITGLTTGAITGVIDRLEKAGFARRVNDPNDRRRVIIEPVMENAERAFTPLFEQAWGPQLAQLESYTDYSDEEFDLIIEFLHKSSQTTREAIARLRRGAAADKS
jgi:DNA-binding MarR family transcriptional regulator